MDDERNDVETWAINNYEARGNSLKCNHRLFDTNSADDVLQSEQKGFW